MKKIVPILSIVLFSVVSLIAQPNPELELVSDAFSSPVDIQNAGDDRLFIVEKGGRIRILNSDGTVNTTPFLNIASQVSNGSEQGLLGLAFHPNYTSNGFFYVYYTDTSGDSQISRFSVDPGDPDIALPGSEFPILDFSQPFSNHNGGDLDFDPDGNLMIASGDGGSGGDPGNRAQNTTLLLGKLLRIDVDNPSGGNNYGIPSDNPFAGDPSNAEEIWAYGLRNPWRFSYDSFTNDIWIGDVGQGDVEEIDRLAGDEPGANYGWRCYEGSQPFNTAGCPPPADLVFPFAEYSSGPGSGNCSITGGIVYRGSDYPEMQGYYFSADVCSGRIFTVDQTGDFIDHGSYGGAWVAFGVDVNEELYIADLSGEIYQIKNDPLVGINDFSTSEIKIFPNPAKGLVNVSIENDTITSLTISNLLGAIVMDQPVLNKQELTFDVSSLRSGLYLISVESKAGERQVKKLVIN